MFRLLHIYIVSALLTVISFGASAQSSDHDFELSRQLDVFNNIYTLLDMHYVDSIDAKSYVGKTIDHMLSTLDPYTVYYPEERRDELLQFAAGHYAGIGVGLRMGKSERRCVIRNVEREGPAEKAGLRAGDVIMRIDNRDVGTAASTDAADVKKYYLEVLGLLKGEPGSTIEIEVKRAGQSRSKSFTVYRQLLNSKSVSYAAMVSDSIGYICLSQFSENTEREMRQAFGALRLRGARSLILDLRGNPGGTLQAAVKTVALFVPKETEVVRTQGKHSFRGVEVHVTATDPIDELMPIVALVDNASASAAEITAGALQDYDRAVILGRRTYGKGLVQGTYDLPYGGLVKLTISRFYIPSGRCIQALDYTRRTPSGDPMPLPDSLSRPFLTSTGRTVYDGGGISPDVSVPADSLPEIVKLLMESDVLYDFAANYARNHRSIGSPLSFEITENDWTAFKTAVITGNFQFGHHSAEAVEKLRMIARSEGYGAEIDAELAALAERFTPNLDRVMEYWRKPIKKLVEQTIVATYYGEAGEVEYNLRSDNDVASAISLLRDNRRYRSILTTAPER